MHQLFSAIFYELKKNFRNSGELLYPVIFYVLCIIMFPLALGPDRFQQAPIASGAVWISAILAISLSIENIFLREYLDGSVEMLILSGTSLTLLCLAKATAYWLSSCLLVLLVTFPVTVMLKIDFLESTVLMLSLCLVTATMSLVGAAVSALTAGLRGGSLLTVTLLLPLLVPPVIFGASATSNTSLGLDPTPELLFLSGFFVLALTLSPWACAAAIRTRIQ